MSESSTSHCRGWNWTGSQADCYLSGIRTGQPQVWAIGVSAGVAAGLISWLAGESVHEFFSPQLFHNQGRVHNVYPTYSRIAEHRRSQERNPCFHRLGRNHGARDGNAPVASPVARFRVVWLLVWAGSRLAALAGALASLGLLPLLLSPGRTGPERFAVADLDPRRRSGWPLAPWAAWRSASE